MCSPTWPWIDVYKRQEKGMAGDRVRTSTGKGRNGQKAEETADEGETERLRAREKGVYYLQFSSKTEEEMRRKLAGQGFSPASVDYAVDYLKERRYLNDEDYARRYVEKNGKRKSERQIRYDLSQKGISSEIIDSVSYTHLDVYKRQYHHITVMGKEDAPCDHKYDITGSCLLYTSGIPLLLQT